MLQGHNLCSSAFYPKQKVLIIQNKIKQCDIEIIFINSNKKSRKICQLEKRLNIAYRYNMIFYYVIN